MRALVLGAGGFIGSHLVRLLKEEGYFVHGADLKYPEFTPSRADRFTLADLRDFGDVRAALATGYDEVYQLAADMGGAGFLFTGENDADVMQHSASINLNIARACVEAKTPKLFFSSSACVYPKHSQASATEPDCAEDTAYPADPDSEYGWEKLFSERLYLSYHRNYGLNVRIARFHNIFGPECAWRGGREKAPAAICRKVAEAPDNGEISIWGDGEQTRSFLAVAECLTATRLLMRSSFTGPVNIGSEELVRIYDLARLIIDLSGKQLRIVCVDGPQGVRGRRSDNRLISQALRWTPSRTLREDMLGLYSWVAAEVAKSRVGKEPAPDIAWSRPLAQPLTS
jgi:GDP-D-mannose 3',5'-epimerase